MKTLTLGREERGELVKGVGRGWGSQWGEERESSAHEDLPETSVYGAGGPRGLAGPESTGRAGPFPRPRLTAPLSSSPVPSGPGPRPAPARGGEDHVSGGLSFPSSLEIQL